jgi:glycopeptide antibiotics resistance protein
LSGKLIFGLFFYGCLIEICQAQTDWRTGDLLDCVANLIGILIAIFIYQLFLKFHQQAIK